MRRPQLLLAAMRLRPVDIRRLQPQMVIPIFRGPFSCAANRAQHDFAPTLFVGPATRVLLVALRVVGGFSAGGVVGKDGEGRAAAYYDRWQKFSIDE